MFLTFMGNGGYLLLRDLCLPKRSVDKSFDDLKSLLFRFINPKPNEVTERFKFKDWRHGDETIM